MIGLFLFAVLVISGCHSAVHTHVHHHTTTAAHHGHHHQTTTSHHGHHHHASTTPHEPDETDGIAFKYDHNSHLMLAEKGKICYIYSMNQDEMASVHSLIGLRTLEIKLIQMIDSRPTTIPMSYLDLQASSHYLYTSCKGETILQLNF